MATPKHILSIIEQHKQPGEYYNIGPELILVQNQRYYGASYHRGRDVVGYLIVHENGELPPKNEVEEQLLIAIGITHIAQVYRTFFLRASKRKLTLTKMARNLLLKLKRSTENIKETDYQVSLDRFLDMTQTMLKEQELARNVTGEMTKFIEKGIQSGVMTMASYEEMQEYQFKIGKAFFNQNYIQMKTYEDRKKVVAYLYQYRKWISALLLSFYNQQLLTDRVNERDRQDFDRAKRRFLEGKKLQEDEEEFQKALSALRNPD
ncbi:hypothetical protein H1164_05780 [Thermoactinomyces daqus]|uniref:Uncharacterized protein n=1 Tax=Thermoactinomyces daqus TaxID=1329516 RepID=A0A7W2AGQ3_9BACL|nr:MULTISPECIES: hypothetical protein [Thermoactinomyces]MBA4542412.1 hypothetical protein [Thermoactinomyces daqus]